MDEAKWEKIRARRILRCSPGKEVVETVGKRNDDNIRSRLLLKSPYTVVRNAPTTVTT